LVGNLVGGAGATIGATIGAAIGAAIQSGCADLRRGLETVANSVTHAADTAADALRGFATAAQGAQAAAGTLSDSIKNFGEALAKAACTAAHIAAEATAHAAARFADAADVVAKSHASVGRSIVEAANSLASGIVCAAAILGITACLCVFDHDRSSTFFVLITNVFPWLAFLLPGKGSIPTLPSL
ncbi:hypothetical protein HK405_002604, partial [Cladochytrium tenue]